MNLTDTHCHIHFPDYDLDVEEVIKEAKKDGVSRLIVVGCTLDDSKSAVEFAQNRDNIWSSIGLHPHQASRYIYDHNALQQFRGLAGQPKVVAIGETGLDYHYLHSPKIDQIKLLKFQLDLALEFKLPLIFHVRDAFSDFFEVLKDYRGISGVIHSFSSGTEDLKQILNTDLYIGLNGIMTFTKNQDQLEAAKSVPLQKLLLETDSPYLTPEPFRGTICQPKHVRVTASFLAELRGESLDELSRTTTANARSLFNL